MRSTERPLWRRLPACFWSKGYEVTSIADLTEAMEVGSLSPYAAFGSKEALYVEALRHYRENYETLVWARFFSTGTAREAVMSLLLDSAAALTGCLGDIPHGCMVTLSSVGSEGHSELGELVRSARAITLDSLKARLGRAVGADEIPAGSRSLIASSHGEGRAEFASPEESARVNGLGMVPVRFVDNPGRVTETYPANPNGYARAALE
ncbi:TetR/AcrR family transcriptional regulator [Cystobacter ferrugineus]|uniref:TetR/AcrR family transcriptional regulator n=1 Tax=Cystobacter ferrugineus TaxID=83449 RepID=UPI001C9DDCF5|nr:TetR/AcrR family transcriptional regulator [Cystobacter ferrugineus]